MKNKRTDDQKDVLFETTKEHALTAGRELLLAAQGMLKFCRKYVETSSEARFKPYLSDIISKAQRVTDDLTKGIVQDVPANKTKKSKKPGKRR
jgi:hypothetical protein